MTHTTPRASCRRKHALLLLLAAAAGSGRLAAAAEGDAPLRLEIRGLRSELGKVNVAVFASEAGFPSQPERALLRQAATPLGGRAVLELALPRGRYAVAAYHDENGNGVLDKNLVGLPKEGVAFSNNPGFSLGAPGFKACALELAAGVSPAAVLEMHY